MTNNQLISLFTPYQELPLLSCGISICLYTPSYILGSYADFIKDEIPSDKNIGIYQ
jgi:hypothetical protein